MWRLVRRETRCAYGCHVERRSMALVGWRGRGRLVVVCAQCADARYGMTCPAPKTFGRDGKAAAMGNDA